MLENWSLRRGSSLREVVATGGLTVYQTLKEVFDHNTKHLEDHCQKYSGTCHIFNSLLGLWKCGQMQSMMFDISLQALMRFQLIFSTLFLVSGNAVKCSL